MTADFQAFQGTASAGHKGPRLIRQLLVCWLGAGERAMGDG
jgi:hypothetical protein